MSSRRRVLHVERLGLSLPAASERDARALACAVAYRLSSVLPACPGPVGDPLRVCVPRVEPTAQADTIVRAIVRALREARR